MYPLPLLLLLFHLPPFPILHLPPSQLHLLENLFLTILHLLDSLVNSCYIIPQSKILPSFYNSYFFFIIQQFPFSTGISVIFAPIEMTSAIYSLSMNLKLYTFKKPSWFNHPHQSLTTTSSILLILLLLLFLSIIRYHILTSTWHYYSLYCVTNLHLMLDYHCLWHSLPTLCMTCNTFLSVPHILLLCPCYTAERVTAFPHISHLSSPLRLNDILTESTHFHLDNIISFLQQIHILHLI